ncbi:Putative two-component response regulator [hydrothermal vent metagenome]|uniref:Putative two-component response regulator n=1 Tax=hydrothermal vent metagenome TaxID=652676 RepID=A0A1W1CEQ0_9ZZZZ
MSSLKLLYIEDDRDIQEIYLDILKESIEKVYSAYDGEEGYELYLSIKPDIILLDINMPKIDGLTLAKKIREVDRDVKIIITTAYGEQDKLLEAIELYLIKYILKPIEPNILREAIKKAIDEITQKQSGGEKNIFLLAKDVTWNSETQKLIKNGDEVRLTKNERRLLSFLSTDSSRIYTFFEIFDHLSYDDFDKEYDANQIRALVKLVRKKIPKDAIINIYGEGYRFNPLR